MSQFQTQQVKINLHQLSAQTITKKPSAAMLAKGDETMKALGIPPEH